MRERFARCLVERKRNQALRRHPELAQVKAEPWPDGFSRLANRPDFVKFPALPWVGGESKRGWGLRALPADPGSGIAGRASSRRRPIRAPILDFLGFCRLRRVLCVGIMAGGYREQPQCPELRSN